MHDKLSWSRHGCCYFFRDLISVVLVLCCSSYVRVCCCSSGLWPLIVGLLIICGSVDELHVLGFNFRKVESVR